MLVVLYGKNVKKRKKDKQKRIFPYKKNFFYAITIICVLPNYTKIQIIDESNPNVDISSTI